MKIGAVIADTYSDKRSARFAIDRTLREFQVDECLLLSDTCFVGGARHVPIEPMSEISDYNRLILDRLAEWADCDAYLFVQWDGFALDRNRWRPEFLQFDYIGAPWAHLRGTVGAGGFSLRSARLIHLLHRVRRQELSPDVDTAEDLQICLKYSDALKSSGLRFADFETAAAFAFERSMDGWYLFVWHAWQRGYRDLGMRALDALADRHPKLWGKVSQKCLRRGMSRQWLRRNSI
jgi:hypothetical protein